MTRPLLVDLFCGAGGASMGYYRAGFNILGVDHKPQKNYPFEFIQGDVFEVWDDLPHDDIAAYAASPPCQAYSVTKSLHDNEHPDLVAATRKLLLRTGKPYVIENVPGAPLINPLTLCGSMFGLNVYKHRRFESVPILWWPPSQCQHNGTYGNIAKMRSTGRTTCPTLAEFDFIDVTGKGFRVADGRRAMGIDWMVTNELSQAIPPAFTEWIGRQLIQVVNR